MWNKYEETKYEMKKSKVYELDIEGRKQNRKSKLYILDENLIFCGLISGVCFKSHPN